MGGSVSAGRNNDELIDHLVEAEFIRTSHIQQVFRAVDRGNYYHSDHRANAYRDIAWKIGNLHLSAPCVYSEVMEALKLKPGLSFLNLGSGSGYFSTVAGLILGPYGINHGIELCKDVVDFAYDRLEEFIATSDAVDEYDFCEPSFVVGNCLQLDLNSQQYDRVYCGASCPPEYETYIKCLVKIGGILIMPLNDKLLKITRVGETAWTTTRVLSVSFAPLITPPSTNESPTHVKLGDISPPKLKHLCRSTIRSILRNNIDKENPNLKNMKRKMEIKQRRQVRRIVIPIFDESDLSGVSQSNSDIECDSDNPEYTISSRIPSRMSVLLEDFLRRHAELQALGEAATAHMHSDSNDSDNDTKIVLEKVDDKRDNEEEKHDIGEHAYSASFNLVSDKCVSTADLASDKSISTADESGSTVPSASSPIAFRTRNKSTVRAKKTHDASKTGETKRKKPLGKRKRPASDNEDKSGPSQVRAKVKRRAATVVWKRLLPPRESDSEIEDESKSNSDKPDNEETYTKHMIKRLGDLPLPNILIRYLNYKRNNM